jgi:hypothetical protein
MRILGVVAVLLLAGCTVTPTVEPVETPSASPTAETVAAPAQVFDGDCGALGLDWDLSVDEQLDPVAALVPNVGGLRCSWTAADRAIIVVLLPETAVTLPVQLGCGEQFDGASTSCAIDVVAGGIRLSGHVLGSDPAQLAADRDEFLARFAAAVAQTTAPAQNTPDPTVWPAALDCAAITEAADLPTATGFDAQFEAESFAFGYGSDAYVAPAEQALRAGFTSCGTFGIGGDDDFGLQYVTLGGARWMETAVREAKGARVVDVDGLELVITVPSPVYGETVNVFDGVNWLQTDQLDDERLYPALAALVDALNG